MARVMDRELVVGLGGALSRQKPVAWGRSEEGQGTRGHTQT